MSLPLVQRLAVGQLLANCFIVHTGGTGCVVIDPGDEPERIFAYLEGNRLTPSHILLTHGHFDHINAAAAVRARYNAPISIHRADACMTGDGEKALAYFLPDMEFNTFTPDRLLEEGDNIEAGEYVFAVLHTPGHSAGSVCYVCGDEMFAGDTIFRGSVGRTDVYSGSPAEQMRTLKRLTGLEGDYILYCGHGENTTLETERRRNPYVRF